MYALRMAAATLALVVTCIGQDEQSLARYKSAYADKLRALDMARDMAISNAPAQYRLNLRNMGARFAAAGDLEAVEAVTNALFTFATTGVVTTNELESSAPDQLRLARKMYLETPETEQRRWLQSRQELDRNYVAELQKLKTELTRLSLNNPALLKQAQAVREEIALIQPQSPVAPTNEAHVVADLTPTNRSPMRETHAAQPLPEDAAPLSPVRDPAFVAASQSATVPANLRRGLVVFCPLDGVGQDFSGLAHHAILRGGVTPAVNRRGIANAAIRLNGIDGCILLDKDIRPQFVTVSLWFRTRERMESVTLLRQRYYGFGMIIDKSGILSLSLYNSSVQGRYYEASTKEDVRDGAWHNAVLTYGPNGFCAYLDDRRLEDPDKKLGTRAIYYSDGVAGANGRAINAGPPEFSLGRTHGSTEFQYPYFKGEIDDLCVWDRELNTSEVAQVFRWR